MACVRSAVVGHWADVFKHFNIGVNINPGCNWQRRRVSKKPKKVVRVSITLLPANSANYTIVLASIIIMSIYIEHIKLEKLLRLPESGDKKQKIILARFSYLISKRLYCFAYVIFSQTPE